jgi:hypothetical protein
VILAIFLEQDHYPLRPTITSSQPKVTNLAGAQHYSHLKVIRLVTSQDVAPLAPPLDVADINNLNIYWHLWQETVLLETQVSGFKSIILSEITQMLNAIFNVNTSS